MHKAKPTRALGPRTIIVTTAGVNVQMIVNKVAGAGKATDLLLSLIVYSPAPCHGIVFSAISFEHVNRFHQPTGSGKHGVLANTAVAMHAVHRMQSVRASMVYTPPGDCSM